MENILDYIKKANKTLAEQPLNAVDSLILAWLSYWQLPEQIKLNGEEVGRSAAIASGKATLGLFAKEKYTGNPFCSLTQQSYAADFLRALAKSRRFSKIIVSDYIEERNPAAEKQFAAFAFRLSPNLLYVGFRGTDGSFVGWKEDFNMTYMSPIPAQERAREFLAGVAAETNGELLVGGHSKGGNLAVYAAATVAPAVQQRIKRVYSHDGPGFLPEFCQSPGFVAIENKIEKILPQTSIIGMLLNSGEQYRVVKSDGFGIMQHDPFTWQVSDGDFIWLEDISKEAKFVDDTLTGWLQTISVADRERFIDCLYALLINNTEADSIEEFKADWKTNIPAVLQSTVHLDELTKKFLLSTVKALAVLGVKNLPLYFSTPARLEERINRLKEHWQKHIGNFLAKL